MLCAISECACEESASVGLLGSGRVKDKDAWRERLEALRVHLSNAGKSGKRPNEKSTDLNERSLARWLREQLANKALPVDQKHSLQDVLQTSILEKCTKWDLHIKDVVGWCESHGNAPSEHSTDPKEASLGLWFRRQGNISSLSDAQRATAQMVREVATFHVSVSEVGTWVQDRGMPKSTAERGTLEYRLYHRVSGWAASLRAGSMPPAHKQCVEKTLPDVVADASEVHSGTVREAQKRFRKLRNEARSAQLAAMSVEEDHVLSDVEVSEGMHAEGMDKQTDGPVVLPQHLEEALEDAMIEFVEGFDELDVVDASIFPFIECQASVRQALEQCGHEWDKRHRDWVRNTLTTLYSDLGCTRNFLRESGLAVEAVGCLLRRAASSHCTSRACTWQHHCGKNWCHFASDRAAAIHTLQQKFPSHLREFPQFVPERARAQFKWDAWLWWSDRLEAAETEGVWFEGVACCCKKIFRLGLREGDGHLLPFRKPFLPSGDTKVVILASDYLCVDCRGAFRAEDLRGGPSESTVTQWANRLTLKTQSYGVQLAYLRVEQCRLKLRSDAMQAAVQPSDDLFSIFTESLSDPVFDHSLCVQDLDLHKLARPSPIGFYDYDEQWFGNLRDHTSPPCPRTLGIEKTDDGQWFAWPLERWVRPPRDPLAPQIPDLEGLFAFTGRPQFCGSHLWCLRSWCRALGGFHKAGKFQHQLQEQEGLRDGDYAITPDGKYVLTLSPAQFEKDMWLSLFKSEVSGLSSVCEAVENERRAMGLKFVAGCEDVEVSARQFLSRVWTDDDEVLKQYKTTYLELKSHNGLHQGAWPCPLIGDMAWKLASQGRRQEARLWKKLQGIAQKLAGPVVRKMQSRTLSEWRLVVARWRVATPAETAETANHSVAEDFVLLGRPHIRNVFCWLFVCALCLPAFLNSFPRDFLHIASIVE